jgi:hypothetical protein
MRYDKCRICGEWGRVSTHQCPPEWIVHIAGDPEGNEYGVKALRAPDAQKAAEKFAHRYDVYFAEYGLVGSCGGESIDVVVCHPMQRGDSQTFTVTGEAVPKYTAREQK